MNINVNKLGNGVVSWQQFHLATVLKLCTKSKIEIETGQKLFTMHFEHQLVLFPSSFVNEEKEKIRHQQ